MAQRVQDMMSKDVQICQPEQSVYEAAVQMKNYDIGALPVCTDNQRLVGIITDRDIVLRCVAENKVDRATVRDAMTQEVITATADMDIEDIAEIMADHQIRRVPVVEGDRLIGICALKDLAIMDEFDDDAEEALSDISEENDQFHAH